MQKAFLVCSSRTVRLAGALLLLFGLIDTQTTGTREVRAQQAPSVPLDPSLRITQYVHEVWNVEQGLPQNSIYAVQQTSNGFLWLGTQEGLVRFDGTQFTVFDRSNGLESNEIRALVEDQAGGLWIGTNGGGVSRLHEGRVTTYTTRDGLSSDLVRSLYEDEAGTLWIGTIDGGLNRFDGTDFTHYTTDDGLAGNVVLSIYEDEAGALWIGTEAGLNRFSDGRFTSFSTRDGLPGDLVWTLLGDEAGVLWIGTTGGLARYDGETFRTFTTNDGLCGSVVSDLHRDRAGSLWIATLDAGLCRLHDGSFEAFSTTHGLTNDRVRSVYQDREGNLWIGTERGGLNRLRSGKFTHVTAAEGLTHDVVFSVLEDRAGTLWIGTEGGGLNRIRDGSVDALTTEDGLPSDHVYALHENRAGDLWIGMYLGGVCRWSENTLTCHSTSDGLGSENVYAVYEDRNGDAWIGTDVGLSVIRDGRVVSVSDDERLANSPITAIHEVRSGDLWVGTYGSGLARMRGGDVVFFTQEDGLASEIVLSLYEDARDRLWVGTQGGGLCRLLDGRFTCAGSEAGLYNDSVLQILEDDDGHFWLGGLRGIHRAAVRSIDAYLDGHGPVVSPVSFGFSDGLKTSETNGGTQPAGWRSRDGRLWFATGRGVASIDPARIPVNLVPPVVLVEGLDVNGIPILLQGSIELPAGSRDLTFHYAALSFTAPEKVRFLYRLEGYDTRWVEAGSRREAYYTNLAPGSYRFLVRAANEDGIWSESTASMSFTLKPHFYQTTWFLLFCLLAVAAAAATAHRVRIRQLQARERELERVVDERTRALRLEKERTEHARQVIQGQAEKLQELDRFKTRFFANVSHEFRTPLTMIVGPLENALQGSYGPVTDQMRRQIDVMLRNGLRLLRLINQLLDLQKLEAGKMALQAVTRDAVAFMEGIVLSCTALAEPKGLTFDFHAAAKRIELCFEPDKLEKVFFNLLSNACKFTPRGGHVSVNLTEMPPDDRMVEGSVEIRVRDTGRGIPPEHLSRIFDRFHQVEGSNTREHEGTGIGLALARELVELHRGTIEVTSDVGQGTEFVVRLPKGTSHLKTEELAKSGDGATTEELPIESLSSAAGKTDAAGDAARISPPGDTASNGAEERVESNAAQQRRLIELAALEASEEDDVPQADVAPADAPLILVVDDNKDVREFVAATIRDRYRVRTARNGLEGLEKADELIPDLIVSDVMMPKMDGNEFCRQVKSSSRLSHVPVVLLTARATHELRMEGLEVGADDYLSKPFNARELHLRIRNLLQLRRQEKELKALNEGLEQKVREQLDLILEERSRYEAALIAAKEKAEASDRLKTGILNNLSHEFRTPLTAILGYAEVLAMDGSEDSREFTDAIERAGKRLLRTLELLLELSSIEADELNAQKEPVDLARAVQESVIPFSGAAEEKGLALRMVAPPDGRTIAYVDRSALHCVVQNLLDNAVKFTDEGTIVVEIGRHGDRAVVAVEDTGIGIGEDFLPRLFEAFSQESEGLTRAYEGVGLGLTVTRRLVDLMDGTIDVETEPGRGSRFTVSLPRNTEGGDTSLSPTPAETSPGRA